MIDLLLISLFLMPVSVEAGEVGEKLNGMNYPQAYLMVDEKTLNQMIQHDHEDKLAVAAHFEGAC
jgi:hypothetical protein